MRNLEEVVALVIGVAVVLFVPALVWVTVIAGLYHIVREKVRENRTLQVESDQQAQLKENKV